MEYYNMLSISVPLGLKLNEISRGRKESLMPAGHSVAPAPMAASKSDIKANSRPEKLEWVDTAPSLHKLPVEDMARDGRAGVGR